MPAKREVWRAGALQETFLVGHVGGFAAYVAHQKGFRGGRVPSRRLAEPHRQICPDTKSGEYLAAAG
jgi:hypothetical protein